MASLNDNLFTTLIHHTTEHEFSCLIQTRWGPLKVSFGEEGPTIVTFDICDTPQATNDSVFRNAVLQWLKEYETISAEEQWMNLAPEGTQFQKKVWRSVLDIPFGQTATYQDIAKQIGQPGASRAVGSAIANNPLALLIPCHRILPSSGGTGNYRWGPDRKFALLEAEQAEGADLTHLFL